MGKIFSYSELKDLIIKTSTLKGEFKLRSGKVSDHYFDKYLFESSPELLYQICWRINHSIPQNFDIYAGLEMGGIPIATILSQINGKPTIFVRKDPKQYGTAKLAEGTDFAGKKLCIVEDIITTGGQVLTSCQELEELGAKIEQIVCVILRDRQGRKRIDESGYQLYTLFDVNQGEHDG